MEGRGEGPREELSPGSEAAPRDAGPLAGRPQGCGLGQPGLCNSAAEAVRLCNNVAEAVSLKQQTLASHSLEAGSWRWRFPLGRVW